jgi:ankyrin repeat protein
LALQCRFRMKEAKSTLCRLRLEAKDIALVVAERNRYRDETNKLRQELEKARSCPSVTLKAKSDEIRMLRQEVQQLQWQLRNAQYGSEASQGTLKQADELRHLMDELNYRESHLILLKKEVESLRSGDTDMSFQSLVSESFTASGSFERPSPSSRKRLVANNSMSPERSLLDNEMRASSYVGRDVTNTSAHFGFSGYGSPIDVDSFYESNELEQLHSSIRQGDRRVFEDILRHATEVCLLVNQGDQYGRTALHLAALALRSDMVESLLSKGAVVNAQDDDGETPLHLAESFTITEILLTKGRANPNIPNVDGICAIHLAVQRRDINSLRVLILNGASVNSADNIRWFTALHLVALPARNVWDEKPSEDLRLRIAQLLTGSFGPDKADLDFQDSEGNAPLHYAVQLETEDAYSLVRLLLENGANPNIRNDREQSPLHLLCHNEGLRQLDTCFLDTLQAMLCHGGDPNIQSMTGCTPLHLALYHKDIDTAVQLVRSGADINLCWKKVSSSPNIISKRERYS